MRQIVCHVVWFSLFVGYLQATGANPENSRTVTVEGIGTTFEDARRDAFRNAINQVVGTLVDAETRVVQEQVIEEIMIASNAYIESHKIIERKQESDGLWQVTMEAIVQYRALQQRLEVAPTISQVDGAGLVGRIDARVTSAETKAASEDDSILMLAKVLRDQNFPYSILEATAEIDDKPVKRDGNTLTVNLNVTVQPNTQKFVEFRTAIEPVLEKIAISKRSVNLTAQQASGDVINGRTATVTPYFHIAGYRDGITRANQTIFVYVNTARNNALTNTSWNAYELPNKAAVLFGAYSDILPAVDVALHANDESMIMVKRIGLLASLFDMGTLFFNCTNRFRTYHAGGRTSDIIFDTLVESGSHCPFLVRSGLTGTNLTLSVGNAGESPFLVRHFFLAPFGNRKVGRDQGRDNIFFMPQLTWQRTITLDTDELESVKTIKSTVISQNPTMDEFHRKLPEFLKNWQPTFR